MIYAFIIICNSAVATCNLSHATYAEQTEPMFSTMDECFSATETYIANNYNKHNDVFSTMGTFTALLYCTEATQEA